MRSNRSGTVLTALSERASGFPGVSLGRTHARHGQASTFSLSPSKWLSARKYTRLPLGAESCCKSAVRFEVASKREILRVTGAAARASLAAHRPALIETAAA